MFLHLNLSLAPMLTAGILHHYMVYMRSQLLVPPMVPLHVIYTSTETPKRGVITNL